MKTALIVDDKEENIYYLRALLEGHGWSVSSARHGAEALVLARKSPPGLVVSDLLMPVMDGYTFLRHWKADSVLRSAPFIVYTATYTRAEDERLALELGADAFILKPSEPKDFLGRIQEVLRRDAQSNPVQPQLASADAQLKLYSETLIRKLEEKTLQLEDSNRSLQEDIQKREAVEAALRKSEALLRIATAAARLGGWSVELPELRVTWSDEVCAIHEVPPGTSPEVEQTIAYFAPKFQNTFRAAVLRCAREGIAFDEEAQLVTAKGRRLWVRVIGDVERDATGAIVRVQGALQDIDERHKLQEQLQQAQKMEAIGQLAGGVAHDFNNILLVILGYTTLVLDDLPSDHPMYADIEEVRRAGDRAAALTRQLLAMSRKQVCQPRALDVGEIVRSMENMLGRLLGEDVELHLISAPSLGRVLSDPSQIEQVVMNLAVNARDAMPRGGKLTIETSNVDITGKEPGYEGITAGRYVCLTVSDTGVGMDAATRERIFEPFFTTKELGRGTGLGLSTVFGIAKQAQGHIHVRTEVGRGATFEVLFPHSDQTAEEVPSERPAPATLRGTETVLVVEDEEPARLMTCAILRRSGYEVLDAQNAGEAFLICDQAPGKRIDLLVTDVVMPRIGGRELAERLTAMRRDMRVLFVSGYTESAVVRHGVLDRGITFLQKPFTPSELLQKVRELLDPQTARDQR